MPLPSFHIAFTVCAAKKSNCGIPLPQVSSRNFKTTIWTWSKAIKAHRTFRKWWRKLSSSMPGLWVSNHLLDGNFVVYKLQYLSGRLKQLLLSSLTNSIQTVLSTLFLHSNLSNLWNFLQVGNLGKQHSSSLWPWYLCVLVSTSAQLCKSANERAYAAYACSAFGSLLALPNGLIWIDMDWQVFWGDGKLNRPAFLYHFVPSPSPSTSVLQVYASWGATEKQSHALTGNPHWPTLPWLP